MVVQPVVAAWVAVPSSALVGSQPFSVAQRRSAQGVIDIGFACCTVPGTGTVLCRTPLHQLRRQCLRNTLLLLLRRLRCSLLLLLQ
jgi:hypothetical protein